MIKSTFSIKDLENLSGIKAHTIRIWEKRHHLLEPDRSETNIRVYNLHALQKILNVSYLKNTGMKISAIATLSNEEIEHRVRTQAESAHQHNLRLQELKLAMVNFDENLFNNVYEAELSQKGFDKVFYDLLIPLLEELGSLWQTNTINIAHEHFISNLIKQKLLIQTQVLDSRQESLDSPTYILFLPENEMHDLGLLFLNYRLRSAGFHTIFLGASMKLDTLSFFQRNGQNPTFVTFITVQPTSKKLPKFLKKFNSKVNQAPLVLLGTKTADLDQEILTPNQKVFKSIEHAMNYFEEQLQSI
ncbi:MerR family transcriptional regulator [Nonlabens agnitus]|uniref:MerR family transcriptional regulator n=1 Tax=Nonlabens agnitus TaxID=870484 RepID=A0A2S9WQQ4_9FLAO|nr:MerR family transcriptional regulator [Nonlabens agnitus]PRP65801.1 MerR family transcriptional regulator [Nonlabens agnitus]